MAYERLIQQSRHNAAIEAEEMNLVSILRPRVFMDGDKWCVLYGEDLMNGVAGFGDSPILAVYDFNKAWRKEISHDRALAQQAAAVDEAMVDRAFAVMRRYDCFFPFNDTALRRLIGEWMAAALSAQQGGRSDD